MATVQITIPDALITRLTAAARGLFPQYNALTPTAAFQAITADKWKEILSVYEARIAQNAGQVATATATQAAIDKAAADASGIG